jgi:maltooligosyltrehalose trehalohydrolase
VSAPAWRASLGAWVERGGVAFRVWAPERNEVALVVEAPEPAHIPMLREPDGTHASFVPGLGAGALYRYRVDGQGPFPDPASRFQPRGVHGPSEVIDPSFPWRDSGWSGLRLEELVVYELHVGCFTGEGSFAALRARLPHLVELGVTALELMPLADFPGQRNWGYDGVSLFAPARCYGRPEELRALVDEAHRLGLGVLLDVVYNHFGPDGAYHAMFSPSYFTERHRTPWGAAINLDDDRCAGVRRFFVENALHWLHEHHLDGLRLDATHALKDDGEPHFLAELGRACRQRARPGVRPLLIAEDHRNLATLVRGEAERGYGLDGVWADDLHHVVRRGLAGDHEGYFRDFAGTSEELAATIRQGWLFCGQHSEHLGGPRGSDPAGIPPRRFLVFLQNHDQVGNRALGERLHHDIELPTFRAATVLSLCLPETPLLFMGQEWAASTPFLYFTDHNPELGRLVTEGRRREFRSFSAFSDAARADRIPDPQAEATFRRSRIDWSELGREPHASVLRLTRALLRLRREDPGLSAADWEGFDARACDREALAVWRRRNGGGGHVLLVRLAGAGRVVGPELAGDPASPWRVRLSSEDPAFAADPQPIRIDESASAPAAEFSRPGAVLLERSK